MRILVSGGAGFIGSHTCVELLNQGYDVTLFDDFSNSSEEVVSKIKEITGKDLKCFKCDMKDKKALEKVFKKDKYDALIHFAGYKAVGESVAKPLMYYENNLFGSVNLFELCKKYEVNKIIFSSSATVYGLSENMPLKEDAPLSVTNPYGRTKLIIEGILEDMAKAEKQFSIVVLRYFNPIGAHESGLIGEDPNGIPNNLMPRLLDVVRGKAGCLMVYGGDYPTPDGTGVRDYIHVTDLAEGHICALRYAFSGFTGIDAFNLGCGRGVSVLELINTFEKVNNVKINYKIVDRRPGDVAENYADVSKAKSILGFTAEKTVEDMCRDSYRFCMKKENMK